MRSFFARLPIALRYVLAGGSAAAVNLALLYLFTAFFGWWYLASATAAFTIAVVVSFTLQKLYTFRDASAAVATQGSFFVGVQLVNIGINTLFVFALVESAGLHYFFAQILSGGIIALWSFFIYRFVIFYQTPTHSASVSMDSQAYEDIFVFEEHHWWFCGRRAIIGEILKRTITKQADRALDVGCGTGYNTTLLAPFAKQVEGLESSSFAAARARRSHPHMVVYEKDLFSLNTDIMPRYGILTMFDVLEHLQDEARALSYAHSLLISGGFLVITVPAFQFLWSEHDIRLGHYRRYTASTLRSALLRSGFQIKKMSYFNFLLFPVVVIVRLWKRLRRNADETSDFFQLPAPLNRFLAHFFGMERFVLRYGKLPYGISLVCVATKI